MLVGVVVDGVVSLRLVSVSAVTIVVVVGGTDSLCVASPNNNNTNSPIPTIVDDCIYVVRASSPLL